MASESLKYIKNLLDACMTHFYDELELMGYTEDNIVAFEMSEDAAVFYMTSGEEIKLTPPNWFLLEENKDVLN